MIMYPDKTSSRKNNVHNVSGVNQHGGKRGKTQVGKTGVEFRYYKKAEFAKLSQEQKDELREHRQQQKDGGGKKSKKSNQQRISALEQSMQERDKLIKEQTQLIATLQTQQGSQTQESQQPATKSILRKPLQPPADANITNQRPR